MDVCAVNILPGSRKCGKPAVYVRSDDWPAGRRETSGLCAECGAYQLGTLEMFPHLRPYIVIKPRP